MMQKTIPLARLHSDTKPGKPGEIPAFVLLAGIITRTPAAEAGSSEAGLGNFQISSLRTRLLDCLRFQ